MAKAKTEPLGSLIAAILTCSWRQSPQPYQCSVEDLKRVLPLLLGSGTAALAWRRVSNSALRSLPEALQLQHSYYHFTLESDLHERDIKQVFTALRSAGIEPLLVKGWAIARLYPEPGLRVYGDIDLYVRPEQHEAAVAVMKRSEYKQYIVDFVYDELSRLDNRTFDELLARSQKLKLDDVEVSVPCAEHHLRLLCMHLLKHGAWRPLWLCDVAAAVEHRPSDFDWEECLGRKQPQRDWIACTIGLAHQLLGADVDHTPIAERATRLPRWLVPAVLKQWEKPCAADHHPAELMVSTLRSGTGLVKALGHRWPDPIQATIRMGAMFNTLPRFPFQLAYCQVQGVRFLARLARALSR